MQVIPVHPGEPDPVCLATACDVLRSGGVVALPTETFYGLAVDASRPEAVARLNVLKGKPRDSPVLLLAADMAQVEAVSRDLPAVLPRLAEAFWPGPLTLVLRAAAGGTVGIRVPGLALPRSLAAALGGALTGVSANVHGQPPPRTAADVRTAFPEGVDLLFDAGPTAGGAPSTVLDLTAPRPTILRAGIVPETALRQFLPDLVL